MLPDLFSISSIYFNLGFAFMTVIVLEIFVKLPSSSFPVVGRSVVIHNNDHSKSLKDCADIVAVSSMKSLTFPNVNPFSR